MGNNGSSEPDTTQSKQSNGGSASLSTRKKLAFATIVLVMTIAIAEILCRYLPSTRKPEIAHYITQWQAQRKSDFWVYQGPGKNADGCRDRQHSVENPDGKWRIACLGDSVTAGFAVSPAESYPYILEQHLRKHIAPVEVFNVAMAGWSVRQELRAYETIVRKYHVDQVILGLCLNDIPEMQNNIASFDAPSILGALFRQSALMRTLLNPHGREIGSVEELFYRADSAQVQNGWELLFAEILTLRDMIVADGAQLVIVVFPFRFQTLPNAPEPIAQRLVLDFCGEHSIKCVDMLPALQPLGSDGFVDYDHLHVRGSRAVVDQLLESGVIKYHYGKP